MLIDAKADVNLYEGNKGYSIVYLAATLNQVVYYMYNKGYRILYLAATLNQVVYYCTTMCTVSSTWQPPSTR